MFWFVSTATFSATSAFVSSMVMNFLRSAVFFGLFLALSWIMSVNHITMSPDTVAVGLVDLMMARSRSGVARE